MRLPALTIPLLLLASASRLAAVPAGQNPFGPEFWSHWGDGRGELASYDLTIPRYGELRKGVAVAIFVTEPFSNSLRVKADPGRHPKTDEFQVMKLNLVRDFPTGIYDYNVMTSVFVGLEPFGKFSAGSPAKVSFSSQEWCGHVYAHLLYRDDGVEHVLHSYFDREADVREKLRQPDGGISEDVLFHWARGFAEPFLKPGESREVNALTSLMTARLQHVPLSWKKARLSREGATTSIDVPAGKFQVKVLKASLGDGRDWTFHVEEKAPHRIIQWETSGGERGALVATERLAYWQMNGKGLESTLGKLGLQRRPPRTP